MKKLELVLSIILMFACAACMVWQVVQNAPLIIIIAFAVMAILSGLIAKVILKE